MSFTRRSILRNISLWILIAGVFSYGVAFAMSFVSDKLILQLALGLGTMTFLTLLIIYSRLTRPMRTIILEMKALLTGKSYRRILTRRKDEIGVLAHFFNEVTRNLENISSEVIEHEALKKELDSAQNIQRELLPKQLPEIPGLDIAAKTRPASEIGGDAYNFYQKDERYFAYIGDSTGHGLPAGLIMIMVDILMDTFIAIENDLLEMLFQINRFLKPNLKATMFMTLILLEWDPNDNKFSWVGAGHEYLIHVNTSEEKIYSVKGGGIALGMIEDNRALTKKQEIKMQKGDFLILFTDGITEAKNVLGEIYGKDRLESFLKLHAKSKISAEDLFEKIAIDVSRFMEGHRQEDDMTLMIFKCLNDPKNEVNAVALSNEAPV